MKEPIGLRKLRQGGRAVSKQANLSVTTERLRKQANKLSNWKSPGPDGVQGYWIKNVKSLHVKMSAMFNECLTSGDVPPDERKNCPYYQRQDQKK